jgi:hypothetical protein
VFAEGGLVMRDAFSEGKRAVFIGENAISLLLPTLTDILFPLEGGLFS